MDTSIFKFSSELEDAGWMGLAASGILAFFKIAGDGPGVLASTNRGIAWTQTLGDATIPREFPFGIGKIKVEGATVTATFGVQFKDGFPCYIDLMVSFLGSGASPSIVFEVDEKYAVLADKLIKPAIEDPPSAEDVIIGYKAERTPLRIPLTIGAMEFNFRINEDVGIQSSMQFFGAGPKMGAGIFELDLDKVIVFPLLCDLGLYVDKLFIDLSSSGTTSFAGLFPEVYDPAWNGIGAQDILFIFPVDPEVKKFITAGVSGFLFGFDKKFSGSFNFNYSNLHPDADINFVNCELEIRNNELLRSEIHIGVILEKAREKLDPTKSNTAPTTPLTAKEQELKDTVKGKYEGNPPEIKLEGVLDFRVDLVFHKIDDDWMLGIDLVVEKISITEDQYFLKLTGTPANAAFWFLGAGGAFYMFSKDKPIAGYLILTAVLVDMIMKGQQLQEERDGVPIEDRTIPLLPRLTQLNLDQLGLRFIRYKKKNYVQVIAGFTLEFELKSVLFDVLFELFKLLPRSQNFSGNLFGESLSNVKIEGPIAADIKNMIVFSSDMSEGDALMVSRLFEKRDFRCSVKKLPEIKFVAEAGNPTPKLLGSIEPIESVTETGDRKLGLAFKLEGLTSPDVTITTPVVGFVMFYYPDVTFEVLPQITLLPKFTFLIPKLLFAEGTIDLNKPLPTFQGTQNKIKIDIGVVHEGEPKAAEYLKINKYKYRMGGEVAWGEAMFTEVEPNRSFNFLFAEAHLESSSPIITVGGAGFFGIGLLFGKNIRPGVNGENNAMGIANWIIGKQAENPGDDQEVFKNVMNWPDVPAADGSTWHPSIAYNAADGSFKDRFSAGATLKIGSAADKGKTFMSDTLLLLGLPEVSIALAGIMVWKKVNTKLTIVIVYDRETFAVKATLEVKVEDEGSFVKGYIWLEFGKVCKDPKHTWFYLAHYLEEKGGPASLHFFSLFFGKGFLVYDSEGLANFGLVPNNDFARPTITGSAVGLGLAVQWGPKRFGPGSVNITLFGILGFNGALASAPSLKFGEVFIGGYIQLKVLCVKTRLELLLLLNGLKIKDAHRFAGVLSIKLNMPWPIPDWKYSTDFVIQTADFVPLPPARVTTSASGLLRLEPAAQNLLVENQIVTLPIDAIIALTFDKPIYGTIYGGTPDQTALLMSDEDPDDDKISETTTTDYQGLKYIINFVHIIESITITRQPISGGAIVTVTEALASWEAPAGYEGANPEPTAEAHHTLFLNSLLPADLKFSSEQLGNYNTWVETRDHVFPCHDPGLYCINQLPRPGVLNGRMNFDTPYGPVIIIRQALSDVLFDDQVNVGDLEWTTSPLRINLPYKTRYDLPYVDIAQFSLMLVNTKPDEGPGKLKNLVRELRIEFEAKLRGNWQPAKFYISLTIDTATPCGWVASMIPLDIDNALFDVQFGNTCAAAGTLAMSIAFRSLHPLFPIDLVTSSGFRVIHNSLQIEEQSEVYRQLATYRLHLDNLCIENTQHISQQWQQTTTGGSSSPADAINDLIVHLLFEPNHEYTITHKIKSFAAIYHDSDDGVEQVQDTSFDIQGLPTVKFRTESEPSQNIGAYLGFTYPFRGQQAPYPSSLTPLLTFRYKGLILKIYEKHFGAGALLQQLVDIDGNELVPELLDIITINSGGDDAALEELLQSCMPNAADFVKLQVSFWNVALATDTQYGLLLKNTHSVTIPFTISFRTSRFVNLLEHVDYVRQLFESPGNDELINAPAFPNEFDTFLDNIELGTTPAYDFAIEKFYLDFLGVESGKLSPSPEQDYVSLITSADAGGDPVYWGVVIELVEPLLGKEGVFLDSLVPYTSVNDTGVFMTPTGLLLLRDFSGTRVIVLNRQASTMVPFTTPQVLSFRFIPLAAIRASIEVYVRSTFLDKDQAQQSLLVDQQIAELLTVPQIASAMTESVDTLNIQIPPAL